MLDMLPSPTIHSIGHSTRSLSDFIMLLECHQIRALADVRLIPRSRRMPHFNDESLARELPGHGIEYHSFGSLGGRRRPHKDSPNNGWRNEGFRGYADYMRTVPFADALEALIAIARRIPAAIMCAEAVPWRCHRSLIADALLVRGWRVRHIMSESEARPHEITSFARVDGLAITYPAETPASDQPSLFPIDELR